MDRSEGGMNMKRRSRYHVQSLLLLCAFMSMSQSCKKIAFLNKDHPNRYIGIYTTVRSSGSGGIPGYPSSSSKDTIEVEIKRGSTEFSLEALGREFELENRRHVFKGSGYSFEISFKKNEFTAKSTSYSKAGSSTTNFHGVKK